MWPPDEGSGLQFVTIDPDGLTRKRAGAFSARGVDCLGEFTAACVNTSQVSENFGRAGVKMLRDKVVVRPL